MFIGWEGCGGEGDVTGMGKDSVVGVLVRMGLNEEKTL